MTDLEIRLAKIRWLLLKLQIADQVKMSTPSRTPWATKLLG